MTFTTYMYHLSGLFFAFALLIVAVAEFVKHLSGEAPDCFRVGEFLALSMILLNTTAASWNYEIQKAEKP